MFTVYYSVATFIQNWRLKSLYTKLSKHIQQKRSIVFYSVGSDLTSNPLSSELCSNHEQARICEDLLWYRDSQRGCAISPYQVLELGQWISFPVALGQNLVPVKHENSPSLELSEFVDKSEIIYLLIETENTPTSAFTFDDILMIEQFGYPIAWKVDSRMAFLLKSNSRKFSEIVLSSFIQGRLVLNDNLPLLRIQSVQIAGEPQPFEMLKNHAKKDSLSRASNLLDKEKWEKHLNALEQLSVLAKQAVEFEIEKIKTEGKIVKPDLISFKCAVATTDKSLDGDITLSPKEVSVASAKSYSASPKKDSIKYISPKKDAPLRISVQESSNTDLSPRGSITSATWLLEASTKEEPTLQKEIDTVSPATSTSKEEVVEIIKSEPKSIEISTVTLNPVLSNDPPAKLSSSATGAPRPILKRTKKGGAISDVKPPNILVFAESNITKDSVISTLKNLLSQDMYTIYSLSVQDVKSKVWIDNTMLLVVCGNVPTHTGEILLDYFLKGGKLLCLCSDILHIVLPTFRMAEVREHELVQFSYGKWKQVKMMHHIFCYQPSPVKKQFSSVEGDELPTYKKPTSSVVPRSIEVNDLQGTSHNLQVEVLGTEETWNTPSLMLARDVSSGGKAVFSQIHLEDDPNLYENDENKYRVLQQNDKFRLEILHDILSTHLGLIVADATIKKESYSSAYFLGRHEHKFELLEKLKPKMSDKGIIDAGLVSMKFYGKNETPDTATDKFLPVLIHSCPEDFSTVVYFDSLQTEKVGRLVIYGTIMASSMFVIDTLTYEHGMVVIPRRQTAGTGRQKNTWLSPDGCLMFSLQLLIPLNSPLGQRISLIQHLVVLAAIKGILDIPGYEDLDIRVKWPNDIYANGSTKIGGSVINTVIESNYAVCNIGVGINLSNSNPTVCVNDLVKEFNLRYGKKLPFLTYEYVLAKIFASIENTYNKIQEGNIEYLYESYYQLWLHSDAEIVILDRQGIERKAKVVGIDDYGYLLVEVEGKRESVHPDGNSFDMFRGLIIPKL